MPAKATTPRTAGAQQLTEIEASDTAATDAALAYDAWFRAEVEAGLREADDPNTVWVSQEEVKREFAARRAEWARKAKSKVSSQ
ncbi:MAG: hypothetical protein ABR910_00225 [Acidobacteriaceae bacterium]|jgi:hypothetical protein